MTNPSNETRDAPSGLGGWLLLPPVMLVLLVIAGLFQLLAFPGLAEIAVGLPQWKVYMLSTQVLFSVLLGIVGPIVLLVLYFRTSRRFPRLFLAWALAYVAFSVLNHFAVIVLFGDMLGVAWSERFSLGALRSLLLAVVPVAVFIPYILNSRRVRNTFVQ